MIPIEDWDIKGNNNFWKDDSPALILISFLIILLILWG